MSDPAKRDKGIALVRRLFAGIDTGGVKMPKTLTNYTMEHVFGDVWQQEDLELEERSLVTCTILIALSREEEQRLHFVGAKNLGIPRSKLEAVITHAAHYAGWPAAVGASRILNEVWPEE
ncbi:MAG: carboxymuconolactone decarboxylase family protein [Pseudomonadota bacterium]